MAAALAPSIPRVQISSSAFSVGIISSIVCLHWKLRGANALICVREIEASFSFWDSLWSTGFSSQGRAKLRAFPHRCGMGKHATKPFLDSKTLYRLV